MALLTHKKTQDSKNSVKFFSALSISQEVLGLTDWIDWLALTEIEVVFWLTQGCHMGNDRQDPGLTYPDFEK